jgi:uncharacterized protein HemY
MVIAGDRAAGFKMRAIPAARPFVSVVSIMLLEAVMIVAAEMTIVVIIVIVTIVVIVGMAVIVRVLCNGNASECRERCSARKNRKALK